MINKTKDPPIKDQLKPERNKTNNPEQAISSCYKNSSRKWQYSFS